MSDPERLRTEEARIRRAYEAVAMITFEGAYYRSDIGRKGVRGRMEDSEER